MRINKEELQKMSIEELTIVLNELMARKQLQESLHHKFMFEIETDIREVHKMRFEKAVDSL